MSTIGALFVALGWIFLWIGIGIFASEMPSPFSIMIYGTMGIVNGLLIIHMEE